MARKNPFVSTLERAVTRLAKAKPAKAYEILDEAFLVFAAAGETEHAAAMVRLVYDGELPRPTKVIHALGTGAMDGFCAAATLPDLTRGEPRIEHLASAKTLKERLGMSEAVVRWRLTLDAYSQPVPKKEWKDLSGCDLYRKAQLLARPGADGALPATEPEALAAFTKYMDAWCNEPDARGFGYGQEVALAVDLALRHGGREHVPRWVSAVGRHLLQWGIQEALCLPVVAKAIVDGLLAPVAALPNDQGRSLRVAIETGAKTLAGAAPTAVAPLKASGKPERRTVSAEYSQFYLEHEHTPIDEVVFQDERESAQGMSIFASHVAIGTPADTANCVVDVSMGKSATVADDAVQAVSFPFAVTGPLFLRSVSGGGEDSDREIVVAPGAYDVLVQFLPRRAKKADAGLRSFHVTMDFFPRGELGAPRCLKLEHGRPPKKIFVQSR